MQTQNYKNHSQIVPGYHFFALFFSFVIFIGAIINTYKSYTFNSGLYSASLILVMSVVVMFIAVYARIFSLRAQDRTIRIEENFRYYLLTKKTLPPELNIRQIIGLRFAEDDEFLDLVDKVVKENLSEKQIKKMITKWRGDYYRV